MQGQTGLFFTSRFGSVCFWGQTQLGFVFKDSTDPHVVFKSDAGAARPRVPHQLSAVECFQRLEPFEGKQLLKSCKTKGRTGPPDLG